MTEALEQNIARDTKDPEIDLVTWTKFGTTCISFKFGHRDNHSDLAIKMFSIDVFPYVII